MATSLRLTVSYLLGQRHTEPATGKPYEGGIVSGGSARVRFSARYYLAAMFFVVFELEAVFLFAWAGAVREIGRVGYCRVLLLVGLLAPALIYLGASARWTGRENRAVRGETEDRRAVDTLIDWLIEKNRAG